MRFGFVHKDKADKANEEKSESKEEKLESVTEPEEVEEEEEEEVTEQYLVYRLISTGQETKIQVQDPEIEEFNAGAVRVTYYDENNLLVEKIFSLSYYADVAVVGSD